MEDSSTLLLYHLGAPGRETGGLGAVTAGHCFVDTGTINNRNVFSGSQNYGGVTSGPSDYPNFDMVRINNGRV